MYKARPTFILIICIVATVVIALLKFFFSDLTYFYSGLMLVILFTIFLKKDTYTYVFGFLAVLIILASVILNDDIHFNHTAIAQMIAIPIAIITTIVVLHIKTLYRSIEKERKQLNALFQFSNEGIILTNGKGEMVLVNPEAQRLFEYDVNELLGKNIEMLIPDRFHSTHINHRSDYNKSPSNINRGHGRDVVALKKNGVEFPIEISLSHYNQQREFFVLAFIIDITLRKESENRLVQQKEQLEKITQDMYKMNTELENKVAERTLILREALQELEKSQMELNEALNKEKELNEIKSRFVSMASHEFRTPLSTVLSSASLINKYQLPEEQEKREKHTRRIKSSVKHLDALLEDFLSLGKLEEGKICTQVGAFDIKEFLQDVFDEMKTGLKQGQRLTLSLEGSECFVTDKRLLKNVLINLINNAIKFSSENKAIAISVDNSGSWLILQIKDQGIGISREDMPHLFSTFYRGQNAVNIQGTGLGLHIVKRYVDLLKGSITLSTQLNEGTTLNIGLPVFERPN